MTQTSRTSRVRRAILTSGALAPLSGVSFPSLAAADKAPPIEDFYKAAVTSGLRLAPGGRSICGLREIKGRSNAVVLDVATRKTLIITNFDDADVTGLAWINRDRLIFALRDRSRGSGDQAPGGIFAIDRDGNGFRELAQRSFTGDGRDLLPAGSSVLGRVGGDSDDIFVQVSSMQARGKFASNVYRVNTKTGQKSLLTLGGPGDVAEWVLDREHVPRVAVSQRDGVTRMHYRDDAQAPWRVVFESAPDAVTKVVSPIAFDKAGALYVSANAGKDNAAIYRFDPKAGALVDEPVAAVKDFDLTGGLVFDQSGSTLLGVRYDADRAGVYWIDPKIAAVQASIDRALPDAVNQIEFDSANPDSPVLINSYSDRDPGRYYLYEPKQRQMLEIAQTRPWIKPAAMRPTTFYRYAARDGMSIPAQLTLPEGPGKHPLVVLHYGGPWVRPIEWHWDPNVQFLVSRGYAVFMPAPRASTGFGAKLFKAGWKQWGLAMQDDVTDGVQALIAQGVVDKDRVCIAGASYGGYLTMMGLVKEPELFRCGINWVGVTDPSFMFTVTWTDFNRVDAGRYDLPITVGDPDKDREQFKRTSPVERASEIKQPVLMAYGGLDRRVPLVNGERMRDAMKPYNKNVEWVVYPDEGHGWSRLENNIDFWTRVEKFLDTNMKPR